VEGSSHGQFEVLSWHLPGGTEENHKNFNQNNPCHSQDSNQPPPTNIMCYCLSWVEYMAQLEVDANNNTA
jgi:hypothetical protein